jgi:hypothetical protein
MKLNKRQQTAAVRIYAIRHGYSASTVRTTSALRYAAFADFEASQAIAAPAPEEEAQALASNDSFYVIRSAFGGYIKANAWHGDTIVDRDRATHFGSYAAAKSRAAADDTIEQA